MVDEHITALFFDRFSPLGIVHSLTYRESLETHVTMGGQQHASVIKHEMSLAIEAPKKSVVADLLEVEPFELNGLHWRLADLQTSLEGREHLRRGVLTVFLDFKA